MLRALVPVESETTRGRSRPDSGGTKKHFTFQRKRFGSSVEVFIKKLRVTDN